MQTKALAVVVGIAGALGLGYWLTHDKKPTRQPTVLKGSTATVGDQVWVETSALPPGSLPPVVQQIAGVGSLIIQVASVDPLRGVLTGPVVGYALQDDNVVAVDPSFLPSFPVPTSAVSAVYRAGLQIA